MIYVIASLSTLVLLFTTYWLGRFALRLLEGGEDFKGGWEHLLAYFLGIVSMAMISTAASMAISIGRMVP